jgi:hypothetical protein
LQCVAPKRTKVGNEQPPKQPLEIYGGFSIEKERGLHSSRSNQVAVLTFKHLYHYSLRVAQHPMQYGSPVLFLAIHLA